MEIYLNNLIITITDINMWINSLYLIAFIILIFILEKPKKIVHNKLKIVFGEELFIMNLLILE